MVCKKLRYACMLAWKQTNAENNWTRLSSNPTKRDNSLILQLYYAHITARLLCEFQPICKCDDVKSNVCTRSSINCNWTCFKQNRDNASYCVSIYFKHTCTTIAWMPLLQNKPWWMNNWNSDHLKWQFNSAYQIDSQQQCHHVLHDKSW